MPSIEVDKSEIKSYEIRYGRGEASKNRQIIIELKNGKKLKSSYSEPKYDADKLIKELDESINY